MDSLEVERALDELLKTTPIGKLEEYELVTTIKDLLGLNERAIGRINKLKVVLILFEYFSNNYWFLFTHIKFNKNVYKKLAELRHELPEKVYIRGVGIVSEFIESTRIGKTDEELMEDVAKIVKDEKDVECMLNFCKTHSEQGIEERMRVLMGISQPEVIKIRLNTSFL